MDCSLCGAHADLYATIKSVAEEFPLTPSVCWACLRARPGLWQKLVSTVQQHIPTAHEKGVYTVFVHEPYLHMDDASVALQHLIAEELALDLMVRTPHMLNDARVVHLSKYLKHVESLALGRYPVIH